MPFCSYEATMLCSSDIHRRLANKTLIGQDPCGPAVLNEVVEDLTQIVVLEHEPFSDELPGGQAHSRLLRRCIKAAKTIVRCCLTRDRKERKTCLRV